ncbi:MAG: hypothetical protein QXH59_09665 [Candidatus Caldarchaeum sp.]
MIRKETLVAAAILTALLLFWVSPLPKIQVLPGFEGLNSGVEGIEISGGFYRIDQPLPQGYRWISQDPKAAVVERELNPLNGPGRVRAELQTPSIVTDPFTVGRTVHYWVKVSENQFVEVEGQINVYRMPLTVSASDIAFSVDEWFNGEKIWFTLTSLTWNKALQKQGADFGQAWEAPLAVVIESYSLQQLGEHFKLDPSEQGRQLTLYKTPQQTGTISDLGLLQGSNINQTFTGDLSPDSRLSRTAFFAITLTDFGCTDHVITVTCPVANYQLKIYTIQIGKFTYTNPDNTPWGSRRPEGFDPLQGLLDWLNNPFNIGGLVIFGWGIVAIVVGLAFLWFFGLPRRRE